MLLQSEGDLIALLSVVAAILLLLSIVGGVIATLKSFQVRQFQDLLFNAERKIDTLERRMFNVLNAVPVALVETDTTGKFTFANKAAHQLLGRKDSELIGLRFHAATWGIAYPDGRAIPADLMPIARTLRGQTVKGFQHMLTNHGSHEKVLVSVTSMPIQNRSGEIIGTTSALVEIESQSGEGVDDMTGLWRGHWFGAATVPFWGLDAKGQVLDINAAALDAFGLQREDVLGKSWAQMFIADSDFPQALDYLGDVQDNTDTADISVSLGVKAPDGITQTCMVTAWVVRTHEGGENGLTVMAIPTDMPVAAPMAAEPVLTAQVVSALGDDEAQELEDFRSGEKALAALGIGVWQYDPTADTIVEDAGMRALIGRETPGGPTLISAEDQVQADAAFTRLMSGEDDEMRLDIRVTSKAGIERWITLKGQASLEDGAREIYGVAYDSTDWKQALGKQAIQTVVPDVVALTEDQLNAARAEGHEAAQAGFMADLDTVRAQARLEGRAEAAAEHAAQLPALPDDGVDLGDVYAWRSAGSVTAGSPIIIHEADPAVVAENEALKAQLAGLQSDLDGLRQAPAPEPVIVREVDPAAAQENSVLKAQIAVLRDELAALRNAPAVEPIVVREADPAVAAALAETQARVAELEDEIAAVAVARDAVQEELDAVLAQPAPVADTSAHEAETAVLRAHIEAARARHDDLAQRYHVLANTPDPEPDHSAYETQIQSLKAELEAARRHMADLTAEVAAVTALPAPEPDYSAYEARIADLADELKDVRDAHEVLKSRYAELANMPAPQPDLSAYEARVAAANGELAKWQAAHRDLQGRIELLTQSLTHKEAETQAQVAGLQTQIDQMAAALSHAQRFETVGRLTGDVAQDFAQMLQVVNGALDVMARTSESPESVRRLAEAALAAGKRGERLTRQLQAFQSEEY